MTPRRLPAAGAGASTGGPPCARQCAAPVLLHLLPCTAAHADWRGEASAEARRGRASLPLNVPIWKQKLVAFTSTAIWLAPTLLEL